MENGSQTGASARETEQIAREREVYHRIQNDLQGLVALMHSTTLQQPESARFLQGPIHHLMSVAQIYRLHSFKRNSRLNIRDLVQAITERLVPAVAVQGFTNNNIEPPLIAENKEVVVALILNQLVSNACKHSQPHPAPEREPEDEEVRARIKIKIDMQPELVCFHIRNRSAALPAGFDFQRGQGLHDGLELIHSILPHQGAALDISQAGDEVVTDLRLTPPVIEAP